MQQAGVAEGLEYGQVVATLGVPDEEIVLSSDGHDPQCAFGDIVIEWYLGVAKEHPEGGALVGGKRERFAQRALRDDRAVVQVDPCLDPVEDAGAPLGAQQPVDLAVPRMSLSAASRSMRYRATMRSRSSRA